LAGGLTNANGSPRSWWAAKEAAAAIDADLWGTVIAAKGDKVGSRQVGKWLTARKDTVFRGRQLAGVPDRNGVMEWTLRGLRGFAGFGPTTIRIFGNVRAISRAAGIGKARETPQTPHNGASGDDPPPATHGFGRCNSCGYIAPLNGEAACGACADASPGAAP
jgi:hypothetical protein